MIANGNYPTMITPYDEYGNIDFSAVMALTEWYWTQGCAGVFSVCQSSEAFYLTLKERIALNKTVVKCAGELNKRDKSKHFTVVASGHISECRDAQAEELTALWETGPDAVILITNRLDIGNTSEKKWCEDLHMLLDVLPKEIKLGLYEAPVPYKRLLSARMLAECAKDGRFVFFKDTSCNMATIKNRCDILRGSNLKLFNANAQTLSVSLACGASGYCGIMSNFLPSLINRICADYSEKGGSDIQDFIGLAAFTEYLNYPVTAKYFLNKYAGIAMRLESRSRRLKELPDYDCFVIDSMYRAAQRYE